MGTLTRTILRFVFPRRRLANFRILFFTEKHSKNARLSALNWLLLIVLVTLISYIGGAKCLAPNPSKFDRILYTILSEIK